MEQVIPGSGTGHWCGGLRKQLSLRTNKDKIQTSNEAMVWISLSAFIFISYYIYSHLHRELLLEGEQQT